MTHYIGILNSKGGVGKTTTAIHLAQALAATYTVELWDADPQGSATDWAYTTEEHGQSLPFPVTSVNHREISRKTTEADFVFIDWMQPQTVAPCSSSPPNQQVWIWPEYGQP